MGLELDINVVQQEAYRPVGGRLRFFERNWRKSSQDPWILETIARCKLEFSGEPQQRHAPVGFPMDREKTDLLDVELQKLDTKQAIEKVRDRAGASFISPMFLVAKADGSWRPVINLKALNTHIQSRHFKMESIRTARGLLQEGDYMVKLDLKDAYLSVPLHSHHRRYVAFHWGRQTWRFKTLPFGLSSAPYIFTKLMKPVVAVLRRLGVRVILYLDDLLIMSASQEGARRPLAAALELLVALGVVINLQKMEMEM